MALAAFLPTTMIPSGASAQVTAPATPAPATGGFGFDTSGMNRSTDPGDDFYAYANGGWVARTLIPADKSSFGSFSGMDDRARQCIGDILDASRKDPGSRIGKLFTSFLDEARVEARGLAPVRPYLNGIAAAQNRDQLAKLVADFQHAGVDGLIDLEISPDQKNPAVHIATLHQAGLTLSGRDYYLQSTKEAVTVRDAYLAYAAAMFAAAGEDQASAKSAAAAVLGFETQVARAQWDEAETRNADKTYNLRSAADLSATAAGLDWQGYLSALGLPQGSHFLVAEPTALTGMAKAWSDTPLPVLKKLLTLKLLTNFAPYLPRSVAAQHFALFGKALSGATEPSARHQRGVDFVATYLGDDVARLYVAQYFPPETKAAVDAIVRNLVEAYKARIRNATWLSAETREKALQKIANAKVLIGYPPTWRDYSSVDIRADDLVGNVARIERFLFAARLARLQQPVDRDHYGLSALSTAGMADPTRVSMEFPAALLQPPLFDPTADPAVNYGAIGAVIGHELSHLLDDQGRKYDPSGRLQDWWEPEDVAAFTARTERLAKQYDAYEALPGLHIDGHRMLGENLADLSGLAIAYDGYIASLGGRPAPVIGGFTGMQRFFLGFAQIQRERYRDARLRDDVMTDVHAPAQWRVETVRNFDPWYAAFGVAAGRKMYLAPADRVVVW